MAVTLNASTTSGLEIASDTSGIVTLKNNGTDALSVSSGNLQFNSGYGSVATAYGCRAWVNFNGTGTVAIRASGNVSSITDNNVGLYTINFTNAMPDSAYTIVGSAGTSYGGADISFKTYAYTTTTCQVGTSLNGSVSDEVYLNVNVLR